MFQRLKGLVRRLRGSVWAPLFARAAGGALVLTLLALFGAGVGDRFFDPGTAHAARSPSANPRGARPLDREGAATPEDAARSASTAALSASATTSASTGASAVPQRGVLPDGRVVLNEASAEQIDKLPGIGLKKAEAIVALRTKLGGKFRRLEDLTRIKGIKRKALERLRPHVVLDAPSTP